MASTIVDYTPSAADDRYADDVQTLIAAGEGKAIQIVVPTGDPATSRDGEPLGYGKEAAKHKRFFQEAAKAAGKSARLVSETDNGDASTTLTFTLGEKIVRKRKDADTDADE